METKQCPTCGELFEPRTSGGKGKGRPQVYCSSNCRTLASNRAWRDRNRPERVTNCAECGKAIAEVMEIGRPRRFCSDECKTRANNRRANRARLPLKDPNPEQKACAHCGNPFTPKRRDRIYCYDSWCIQSAYRKRKAGGDPQLAVERLVTCHGCGTEFTAKHPSARWCSKPCANRHWGRVRSRQRGTLSTARYTDREIFERDAWTCHLCGGAVDAQTDRNNPDGATIDHVIPNSLGGPDEPGNVATAHRRCNLDKRNFVRVEDLTEWAREHHPELVRNILALLDR